MPMFSKAAIERRLGLQDARGPQGVMSRGANVYRGGMPNAQSGGGNPNIGRPSLNPPGGGPQTPSPSMTTYFGSLPPNQGMQDPTMNDALMNLLRTKFQGGNPSA